MRMRRLTVVAALLLAMAIGAPAFAQSQGWPSWFEGSPGTLRPNAFLGYYVWHDGDEWHVRWTTRGRTREFSGVISTDGRVSDVRQVRLERRTDRLRLTDRRSELHFEATNTGAVDGFDFRVRGDRVTFDLRIDGQRAAVEQVRLGRRGVAPAGVPFTARRDDGRDRGADVARGPVVVRPGEATAYFIWREGDLWHVRWTTQTLFSVFSGSVESSTRVTAVSRIGFDPWDEVAASGDRITFRSFTLGGVEGFDFRTSGDVVFELTINGRTVSSGQVFVGARRLQPASVPFEIAGGRDLRPRPRPVTRGWPAVVEGDPGRLSRETRLGYYVWHDDAGWHVRWSTSGGDRQFSGRVTTDGEFRNVQRVRLERQWDAVVTGDQQIRFSAGNSGWVDGFDFRVSPGTTRITFDLLLDGQRIRPTLVFLGGSGAHPQAVPFTFTAR